MQAWARRCFEIVAVATLLALTAVTTGVPGTGSEAERGGAASGRVDIDQPARLWIDTGHRESVVAAYNREFETPPPVLAWTGDHEGCESGSSPAEYRRATLDRVNFYRAMAGVPAVVTENAVFSAKAQDAALMMSAEGTLTHHPTDDFGCFSVTGQQAAANSNLHLGRTGPEAIDGYIEDPGPKNTDVGHRNTVLHPPTQTMGIGDVAASSSGHAANALWVFDERVFNETSPDDQPPLREELRFVAWPPRGFVPADLVFPRWSFTLAGADFSDADVRLFHLTSGAGAREVPLAVVDRVGAVGHVPLPTIVWEPTIEESHGRDESYLVVVAGVGYFDRRATAPVGETTPPIIEALGEPERPSTYAYTVRILGQEPDVRLTPEDFLASVSPLPPT